MSDLDTQYCINSAYEKGLVDRGFHSDNPATTDMITIRKRCLGEDPYDDRTASYEQRASVTEGWMGTHRSLCNFASRMCSTFDTGSKSDLFK